MITDGAGPAVEFVVDAHAGLVGAGRTELARLIFGADEKDAGEILVNGEPMHARSPYNAIRDGLVYVPADRQEALLPQRSVRENIALPLQQYTNLNPGQIREIVSLKLSLVGLAGFDEYYPSEISGGMQKRVGLARAIALDPEIVFFDEPSAGLDPISARLLDDLILELSESLGATVVIVTHELASIFAIGNNSVFLDPEAKTMIAQGDPKKLLAESKNPTVHKFLTRGEG